MCENIHEFSLSIGVVLELTRGVMEALLAERPELGPVMQASVERGLRLLERDAAAKELTPGRTETSILDRVRLFFAQS